VCVLLVERVQVLKERNTRNTKKESAQVLFDFDCEVTKTSDTQLGKRTFQDSYHAASTIDPAVSTWLGTVFSTDEYGNLINTFFFSLNFKE
jgi:hypothetical protein